MKRVFRVLSWAGAVVLCTGLLLFGAMFAVVTDVPKPQGEPISKIVFTNVNIVDPQSNLILPSKIIVVDDGMITAINDANSAMPSDHQVKDMRGAYAIAGFWDMHAHFPRMSEHFSGPMMIMHGVFYARDMSGDCAGSSCIFNRSIQENRIFDKKVQNHRMLGPEIVERGSFIVHGPKIANTGPANRYGTRPSFLAPSTRKDGEDLVNHLARRGIDFVKPYDSIPPEVFRGMSKGAASNGIYLGGHVPKAFTLTQAIAGAQRTIEHARMLPFACSGENQPYADEYASWLNDQDPEAKQPKARSRYGAAIDSIDQTACDRLLTFWSKTNTYYVPTHITRQSEFLVHTGAYRADERSDFVPEWILSFEWAPEEAFYKELFQQSPISLEEHIDFFERGVFLTGEAHKAGVKLLVGTDTGDLLVYPGASYHDEMSIYADAGLTPSEILSAATIAAAEFVGNSEQHGSIGVGKRANMIFLDHNPLDDVRNTRSISGLYYQNRFYDEKARSLVLKEVSSKAAGTRHNLILGWLFITKIIPAIPEHGLPGDDYAPSRDSYHCRYH